MSFVDIGEIKSGLRIRHDDDDPFLQMLAEAATGIIADYLKSAAAEYLGDDGQVLDPGAVPAKIKAATIFLVGVMERNRDQDPEGMFADGRLPMPVRAMLYPLRVPTLA